MNQFDCEFPLRPDALIDVRTRFARWASAAAADPEASSELTIVLSELGANAIDAATSSSSIGSVRAWRDHEAIVLEVSNAPADRLESVVVHQSGHPLRGRGRGRGRGLGIVAAFTDSVEVVPPAQGVGLTIRCRKTLASGAGRPLDPVAS